MAYKTIAWRKSMRVTAVLGDKGISPKKLASYRLRAAKAWKYVQENRGKDELYMGWTELPYNQNEIVADIMATAKTIRSKFQNFVVLGIGGSALGPTMAFNALCHLHYNDLPKSVRRGPKFFVEDNVDPVRMRDLLGEFNTYLKNVKKASGNTLASYIRDVKKFEQFLYANKKKEFSQASRKLVEEYVSELTASGKSNATVTRSVSSLRCFYNFLISADVVENNPTKGIVTAKSKRKLPQILTNAEVNLLKGYRDRAMLEVLYATGMRVTELIELDIRNVNLELGFIHCTADEHERVIPLYSAAVTALEEYISRARKLLITSSPLHWQRVKTL